MNKNVIKCKLELIDWLREKPYYDPSISNTFVNRRNDIGVYISDILRMRRIKVHFSDTIYHKFLLEHIGLILVKYNIFTINISGFMYKYTNSKWIFENNKPLHF